MTDAFVSLNRWLEETDKILVVSHIQPDGDAIGSTLAMGHILKKLGKEVVMVNESPIPKKFHVLPGVGEILQPEQVGSSFDTAIALDCADRDRMGSCLRLISEQSFLVNIDHHATNDFFGNLNIVEPDRAATVEILFDWMDHSQMEWDPVLATYIYTGFLTDTGGFRYPNTTPALLHKAAKVVEWGIEAHRIADAVLESVTMEQLHLLKVALETLERSEDGQVAWMSLKQSDLERLKATHEDLDGIVNYARNILGVDVGLLFRETGEGTVRVSFRSRELADVGQVAKHFGGGGHARAAGCTFQGTLEEAKLQIIAQIQAELKGESR